MPATLQYHSTRGAAPGLTAGPAIAQGLAPDGGLYVPDTLPSFSVADFDGATTLSEVAARFLAPFFAGDPLAPRVPEICAEAFNFPVLLRDLPARDGGHQSVLELFHGPTAAFKDFGARFLAACMERLPHPADRRTTILVATSGDTGGAVAAAFHGRPWARVIVLFPKGLVSPRQERQLTCWGGNVQALSVHGTFDDCQRMVKAAFADAALTERHALTSANSINLGRLLPQATYYAWSSLEYLRRHGVRPGYIVPSGNLGNVMACLWARSAGLPIGRVVLAHNANRTVPDFLATGEWLPRPSVATLASAMDVGNPSNMERLRDLHPALGNLREAVSATVTDDAAIRHAIVAERELHGEVFCPHTAVAADAWLHMTAADRAQRWIWVATAHPAKFPETVEPLVGPVEVPPALARLLELPSHATEAPATLDALRAALEAA
jgi:threonine synthase